MSWIYQQKLASNIFSCEFSLKPIQWTTDWLVAALYGTMILYHYWTSPKQQGDSQHPPKSHGPTCVEGPTWRRLALKSWPKAGPTSTDGPSRHRPFSIAMTPPFQACRCSWGRPGSARLIWSLTSWKTQIPRCLFNFTIRILIFQMGIPTSD